MQPHHHGGKGHLALHTVLPDGIDDSRREVDMEVAEEDDAVWVLGTERAGSAAEYMLVRNWGHLPPTGSPFNRELHGHGRKKKKGQGQQRAGWRPLSRRIPRLSSTGMTDKLAPN